MMLLQPSDSSPSSEDLHVAPIAEGDIGVSVVDENGSKVRTPKLGLPTIVEVTFSVGMVEEPEFQVLYGKSRQVLESMASYETTENKCWNIEFVPRCAGKHLVQIWLGGVAIAVKDDVTIDGKPSVGSRVCPGPDWVAPDDTSLYLEGTVVRTNVAHVEVDWKQDPGAVDERTTLFAHPVVNVEETKEEADSLEALHEEPMEMDDIIFYRRDTVGGFEEQLVVPSHVPATDDSDTEEKGGQTALGDSAEITQMGTPLLVTRAPTTNTPAVIESDDSEDEPRPKFVHRKHKWGGFLSSGVYEVELIL